MTSEFVYNQFLKDENSFFQDTLKHLYNGI